MPESILRLNSIISTFPDSNTRDGFGAVTGGLSKLRARLPGLSPSAIQRFSDSADYYTPVYHTFHFFSQEFRISGLQRLHYAKDHTMPIRRGAPPPIQDMINQVGVDLVPELN